MAVLAAALKNMKVIQVHGIERKNMIIAIIILAILAIIEFLLIYGLIVRSEEDRRNIKEINEFLDKYTEKNQKSNEKMTEAISLLAEKLIKLGGQA